MKIRLDILLNSKDLTETRSQAENLIRLGKVIVDGNKVTKPGAFVDDRSKISILGSERYVSRAGLKLASVSNALGINFDRATVLDVGSSTGGFSDYAIQHGAKKVYAVDVGTKQLHPILRQNSKIELHEKTDIRSFKLKNKPDIVVIDVSFISLREILPHITKELCGSNTTIVAMVKPQFEAGKNGTVRGIVKNNSVRRQIMKDFEQWCVMNKLLIQSKRDSEVRGAKGNQERFYKLKLTK